MTVSVVVGPKDNGNRAMMRIEDAAASAAIDMVSAARTLIKEGRTEAAGHLLTAAETTLKTALQPSRAPRGKGRGPVGGPGRAKTQAAAPRGH